ncbi:hypothetical protein B6N60_01098 [Richelia sinica FACHB-800]|uniref:Uncharacterized protein n=1 Tax=Richelia sinica FACHB-800 TaxID=1357546 RepID=A0A975T5S2_9NOST|nr:hypothetical protein B6N60_01098 [Richelia sinica FACHB-800]
MWKNRGGGCGNFTPTMDDHQGGSAEISDRSLVEFKQHNK